MVYHEISYEKNDDLLGYPHFSKPPSSAPFPIRKADRAAAQGWASELADFCDQQQGDAHRLKASPANGRWVESPIGSMGLLYMVKWIPSIYPCHVSIYTSTMDPMGNVICMVW